MGLLRGPGHLLDRYMLSPRPSRRLRKNIY